VLVWWTIWLEMKRAHNFTLSQNIIGSRVNSLTKVKTDRMSAFSPSKQSLTYHRRKLDGNLTGLSLLFLMS